jgi:hypothetical protein
MRILLIDDLEEMRDPIANYFRSLPGVTVLEQETGVGGSRAADAHPGWTAIVIDRQLTWERGSGAASGDGLVLAAILRRNVHHKNTSIIVYSRGWIHEDPRRIAEEYEKSGIFPVDAADGPAIGEIIKRSLGLGPWLWMG